MSAVLSIVEPDVKTNAEASCRFCGASLRRTFIDLGMSPLCETFPSAEDLNGAESYFPLHVFVCEECLLVQLQEYQSPQKIFTEYAYFSSYSDTWLKHSKKYCLEMKERLGLDSDSFVIEAASNDGYLLQYFVELGVPVLGIEPAANVARAALQKGVPTSVNFLDTPLAEQLASEGRQADLVLGNNVLAQVPDLNGFVESLRILLKPRGVLTLEFPHLLRLIEHNEFDTIYHEHFSYFSLHTTVRILRAHGLRVFDVEELRTHGGSLRVFACLETEDAYSQRPSLEKVLRDEQAAGLATIDGYGDFRDRVQQTKWKLMEFLITARRRGKTIAGYGAPGKSATLLHYCGIGRDLLDFTVDRNPYKQGRFLPGTHIPIYHPDKLALCKPDYVLILPWNLKDEILNQLSYIGAWEGRFVVPIPEVASFDATGRQLS
jgi:SAM-dependent methyltransferase